MLVSDKFFFSYIGRENWQWKGACIGKNNQGRFTRIFYCFLTWNGTIWCEWCWKSYSVDSVFEKKGNHPTPIPLDDYLTKMVSATASGVNVSMGKYNGALTMMARERPWLIVIHCMNHHIDLAIKDMVKSVDKFEECNKFNTIFNLFKNSGKPQSATKEACTALNITYYWLSKIHSTRFVNHHRWGFTALLHDLPALIASFTNALFGKISKPETKVKIKAILNKLKDYRFLCCVASYLDILGVYFTVIPYFWEKVFDGLWSQACCGKNIVEFTRIEQRNSGWWCDWQFLTQILNLKQWWWR